MREPVVAAGAADCGLTFGVEEEFHLVDPETFELVTSPELTGEAAAAQRLCSNVHARGASTRSS